MRFTICCSTSGHPSKEDVGDKNKVNIIQKKEKGHTKTSPGAAILPRRPQKRLWFTICCLTSGHQSEEDVGDDMIDRRQKQGESYPEKGKGPHEKVAGRCHSPWAATEMYVSINRLLLLLFSPPSIQRSSHFLTLHFHSFFPIFTPFYELRCSSLINSSNICPSLIAGRGEVAQHLK